jgi:hypothetical protein
MGKNKKEHKYQQIEEIVERFRSLSTKQLIERRDLFGNSLSDPFKIAINLILKERGVKD